MFTTLATIAPVFFIILVGSIMRLTGIAGERWVEVLNRFGLYIGFPALIFNSIVGIQQIKDMYSLETGLTAAILCGIMIIVYGLCALWGLVPSLRNTYIICIFYGNVAYMGFPIITTLLPGSEGRVSFNVAIYLLLLFTVGMIPLELSRQQRDRPLTIISRLMKNPLFLAVLAGIACIVIDIRPPLMIQKTISMLAGSASPSVLIALGIFIAKGADSSLQMRHSLVISMAKLLAVPACFFFVSLLFAPIDMRVSILEAAMPVGLTPFILAERYSLDRSVIATSIMLTTLLSALTLSLMTQLSGLP